MTAFVEKNFEFHGGFLHYTTNTGERKFAARFKHRGPVTRNKFVKCLIKNYLVDDYFAKLVTMAPLEILRNDSYLVFDLETRTFTLDGNALV